MLHKILKHSLSQKINATVRTGILTLFLLFSVILGVYLAYIMLKNQEVVNIFSQDKLNLVIEDQVVNGFPAIKEVNNEILIPLEIMKKYLDQEILFDAPSARFIITKKDAVIRMKLGSNVAMVNNQSVNLSVPAQKEGDTVLLPLKFLSSYYKLDVKKSLVTNTILIDRMDNVKNERGTIIEENSVIRLNPSIRAPIVFRTGTNVPISVRLFENNTNSSWKKVRTEDGYIGYITNDSLEILNANQPEEKVQKMDSPITGKIIMAWEMAYQKRNDFSKDKKIQGLDVISPTWFQILNENGGMISRAYKEYMVWAHGNGYKVWALFSNDFNSPTMTGKALNSSEAREKLIRQLIEKVEAYGIDGINIDFEQINKKDRAMALQFVKEISPLLREKGCVVSVDIPVPDGYDALYDEAALKSLGNVVDYLVMMGYDQYWSGSTEAGSVAQLSWAENNLKKLISYQIPKEKIILGIPFYTRLWEESQDKNRKTSVSGKTVLNMTQAKRLIGQNNANVIWQEVSGQYYAEYYKGNNRYKIWLEDENSVNIRSSLVLKYEIAGIAAWSKGSEIPEVWSVLNQNLKDFKTYDEWNSESNALKLNLN